MPAIGIGLIATPAAYGSAAPTTPIRRQRALHHNLVADDLSAGFVEEMRP
jgi:hypothetical protein